MIPLADGNENVVDLHPILRARVEALCADPRVRGQLLVESAVRTKAEQEYLYAGWIARRPGFNLAADPNRVIGSLYDVSVGRGSWHMEQETGFGYAVDFRTSVLDADILADLPAIAADYLLWPPILAKENWHYQMVEWDWTTLPATHADPIVSPEDPTVSEFIAVTSGGKYHVDTRGSFVVKLGGEDDARALRTELKLPEVSVSATYVANAAKEG